MADDRAENYLTAWYVVVVADSTSVVFLLLSLLAFLLLPELRNLAGMNLASLSLALLIMHAAHLAVLNESHHWWALLVVGIYGSLAHVLWMLTVSFDVWRTLRLATRDPHGVADKQWCRRFALYSAWAWLPPAFLTIAYHVLGLYIEVYMPMSTISTALLAVALLINAVLCVSSRLMIAKAPAELRDASWLYLLLALVMELTWVLELTAISVDHRNLWLLSFEVNGLKGPFIFVAFTCRRKVIRKLEVALQCRRARAPRHCSSTDRGARRGRLDGEPGGGTTTGTDGASYRQQVDTCHLALEVL